MRPTERCLHGPRQRRATHAAGERPALRSLSLLRLSGSEGDGGAEGVVNCSVSLNELCKLTTLRKAARCLSGGAGRWWPGAAPSLPTCCAVTDPETRGGERLGGNVTPTPLFIRSRLC